MNDTVPVSSRPWPDTLERGRVGDAAFAAAYARLPARERAWIKTGLAAQFAAYGGPWPVQAERRTALGHDLTFLCREEPLDFVLVACAAPFASPARLAAAVVAALCARVPEVAAVRIGGAWPKALLTTLELCGVESVFRLGVRALAGLSRELAARGRGALVLLDGPRLPAAFAPEMPVLPARTAGKIGVFAEPGTDFDWDALAFAQPDLTVCVHGGPCPDRPRFTAAEGGLAEAAALGYDAVYVAAARLETALGAAPLVLGPGRESCWLWPGLGPAAFRRQHLGAGRRSE